MAQDAAVTPTVAVVIPAHNCESSLPRQLEALAGQQDAPAFTVLVVDNGSSDRTSLVAESYSDILALRVVHAADKPGAAHARNVGVTQSGTDIVAFCDADDVVDSRWLGTIVRAVLDSDGAIVTGGLRHDIVNGRDALYAYGISAAAPPDQTPPLRSHDQPFAGYLPSVCSANFAMTSALYQIVGGMDTSFVAGAEDTDFAWRAQLAGVHVVVSAGAFVHYRLRDTARGIFRQQRMRHVGKIQLWARYRETSMVGPSWRGSLVGLMRECLRFPANAWTRAGRFRSAYLLGAHLGALQGMFEYRFRPAALASASRVGLAKRRRSAQ